MDIRSIKYDESILATYVAEVKEAYRYHINDASTIPISERHIAYTPKELFPIAASRELEYWKALNRVADSASRMDMSVAFGNFNNKVNEELKSVLSSVQDHEYDETVISKVNTVIDRMAPGHWQSLQDSEIESTQKASPQLPLKYGSPVPTTDGGSHIIHPSNSTTRVEGYSSQLPSNTTGAEVTFPSKGSTRKTIKDWFCKGKKRGGRK
ncbi:uncharacterized protein L201_008034 [Kwoniella dendrophila CBS 6074]|uniref:Uncharacterized protein n=1 Tax=Kwoniella dendrophila CBS 6074 TaxID=1295534 RepID=A0AAX4K7E4_9TREE